jgi:N-acyl-D-amino-acid deacylase
MIDLLILNGTVIDGSGNPGYKAAVAVEGDSIRVLRGEVGRVEAGRRIDATGCIVAPGFIDMHSHSPLMILANPTHAPKVRQGVTTEVIGVDGHSYAPFTRREDLLAFVEMNSGLEGSPPIDYDWSTVTSYLSRYDRKVAVNIALLVGNSALRISALGWDDTPASPQAMAQMRALLREAMEEGAFGLSTGLDYPPGVYATTEELGELATEAAREEEGTLPGIAGYLVGPVTILRGPDMDASGVLHHIMICGQERRRIFSPATLSAPPLDLLLRRIAYL